MPALATWSDTTRDQEILFFSWLRYKMYFSYDVYCIVLFFPGVFFHFRVIGACPVTTDWICGDELIQTTNATRMGAPPRLCI